MNTSLQAYRQSREELLSRIVSELSNDERFIAAWLTGSYSRNEADFFSDLDLSLVVADAYSTSFCTRLEQVSARTSPERYALFSQFGQTALLHENNNNAPQDGTFTFVLYAESAIMIDWVLIPQIQARRPLQSHLLFEKIAIPFMPALKPEDLEQSKKYVAEQWAFFWMMTAVTIKYIHRGDSVFVTEWIEHLHQLVHEMERRLNGEARNYRRGSFSRLPSTRKKQLESIRELCNRVQGLEASVTAFNGSKPMSPLAEIEQLLSLADK